MCDLSLSGANSKKAKNEYQTYFPYELNGRCIRQMRVKVSALKSVISATASSSLWSNLRVNEDWAHPPSSQKRPRIVQPELHIPEVLEAHLLVWASASVSHLIIMEVVRSTRQRAQLAKARKGGNGEVSRELQGVWGCIIHLTISSFTLPSWP